MEFLSRKRVDGIISMPVDAEGNHLKKFQKTGKPIVLIDRRIRELSCDSVLVDNEKAAEDAMRVFFQAGHRKIGSIGGPGGNFHSTGTSPGVPQCIRKRKYTGTGISDLSRRLYHSGRCAGNREACCGQSGYDGRVCYQL